MRFSRKIRATSLWAVVGFGLVVGCGELDTGSGSSDFVDVPRVSAALRAAPELPLACQQGTDPFLTVLEREVGPGAELRVLAVSERPLTGLRVRVDGVSETLSVLHRPISQGPPYAVVFAGRAPGRTGRHAVRLVEEDAGRLQRACVRVAVTPLAAHQPRPAPAAAKGAAAGVWRIRRGWHAGWERAFSAWVAHLFRPLPGQPEPTGWKPLHRVLRRASRNLLHNRLGHAEDSDASEVKVHAWADCGDTPYQLRAYFAWKFGLPFRYRRCSRGNSLRGPRCPARRDNLTAEFDRMAHPVRRFNAFIRQGLAWWVHSGTLRTLPEDEGSDFYPIRLERGSIRPGTVYVDVAGHALVVTQWDERGLYAIDGHPDMSVTRRRFSEKHFRYIRGTRTGGFKAFRPLRLEQGRIVPVPNRSLRRFFSVEQYRFARRRDFYSQMHRLIDQS